MKKLLIALILPMLLCALCSPAFAANDYGLVYDATEQLDAQFCETLNSEVLPELSERCGAQVQIDVVDDLEGNTIEDYAQLFYSQYGYGAADTGNCIYLMLYLTEDANGLAFEEYYILCGGEAQDALYDFAQTIPAWLDTAWNAETWSGGIDDDNAAFQTAMQEYARSIETYFEEPDGTDKPDGTKEPDTAPADDISLDYVTDSAVLLTDVEWAQLNAKAEVLAKEYQCAVYIVTVDDYMDFDSDGVYDAATAIYRKYALGWGEGKDGILLLLSMADRDYALFTNGYGDTACTDYGISSLESAFLDDFSDDDWYGGFEDYLEQSSEVLRLARAGTPLDASSDPLIHYGGIGLSILIALLLSTLVCLILRGKMKSVHMGKEAAAYVVNNSVNFTVREDRFSHTTEVRTKIERESSSSGGGSSGSSGKF